MTIGDQTEDDKLQYDINREAVKTSALSSVKIDKLWVKIIDKLSYLWRNITT